MCRLRFSLLSFNPFKYPTLEESIDQHINSTGNGFELDDVISSGHYSKEAVDEILAIAKKYRTPEYPIGTSNPESFAELKAMGKRLAKPSTDGKGGMVDN